MYAKTALALLASATLADQALAGANIHHRHMHQLHDRAIKYVKTDVVVVTDYITVTVTDGEPGSTRFMAANRPHRTEGYASLDVSTSTSTSSTSSTTSSPAPAVETPPPAAVPTTLVTQAKPAPEPTVAAPADPAPPAPAAPAPPAVNVQQDAPATPPPTKAPPPVASTGGKKGFAYNNADFINTFFTGGNGCNGCGWAYNWDSSDYGNLRDGIEFVPMLWSPAPDHSNSWASNANKMLAKGAKALLSFNEPDNGGQANLDAQTAAQAHVKHMNPFAGRARIGSPAITNSGSPNEGLGWLRQFIGACDSIGCQIDFCVTHWYADTNSGQTLLDHLASVSKICHNKPVWLTEFAPFGSDDQIADFLSTYLPKLDALPFLERFSYFMVNTGSLLSSTNSLSKYGKVYASA